MTAELIDGAAVAAKVRQAVAQRAAEFAARTGRAPGLATILVGEDPASMVYVGGKIRACNEVGINSFHHPLPEATTQAALLALIEQLSADDTVDGILVQVPLPAHISEAVILESIVPQKDVDGFHPINVGRVAAGSDQALAQCTPAGIMRLLDAYGVTIPGADVTIIGRSALVGRPLALMMMARGATVSVTHSRTRDLPVFARTADILIAATGVPGLVTGDMVRPDSVVIDVGITRTENGLRGDVDFAAASRKARLITPVPGGVGPMTIAMLLENTVIAAERMHP